jgi:hypothetical protein
VATKGHDDHGCKKADLLEREEAIYTELREGTKKLFPICCILVLYIAVGLSSEWSKGHSKCLDCRVIDFLEVDQSDAAF